MEGINTFDALFKFVAAFIEPSILELRIPVLRRALMRAKNRHGRREDLPAYQLRVDGRLIRRFLVDIYDGPFATEEDLLVATVRRSGREVVA